MIILSSSTVKMHPARVVEGDVIVVGCGNKKNYLMKVLHEKGEEVHGSWINSSDPNEDVGRDSILAKVMGWDGCSRTPSGLLAKIKKLKF